MHTVKCSHIMRWLLITINWKLYLQIQLFPTFFFESKSQPSFPNLTERECTASVSNQTHQPHDWEKQLPDKSWHYLICHVGHHNTWTHNTGIDALWKVNSTEYLWHCLSNKHMQRTCSDQSHSPWKRGEQFLTLFQESASLLSAWEWHKPAWEWTLKVVPQVESH